MRVEPNSAVDLSAEHILCEKGAVHLHSGKVIAADILDGDQDFEDFCKSLDPNKTYIGAFVPDRADEFVFFKAREVGTQHGIHVQATLEVAERLYEQWEIYKETKSL